MKRRIQFSHMLTEYIWDGCITEHYGGIGVNLWQELTDKFMDAQLTIEIIEIINKGIENEG